MHWVCLVSGWVPGAACMEQLILGAVRAPLYSDQSLFMSARPLLSLAHAGGQGRPAGSAHMTSSAPAGWGICWGERAAKGQNTGRDWEWAVGAERKGGIKKKITIKQRGLAPRSKLKQSGRAGLSFSVCCIFIWILVSPGGNWLQPFLHLQCNPCPIRTLLWKDVNSVIKVSIF